MNPLESRITHSDSASRLRRLAAVRAAVLTVAFIMMVALVPLITSQSGSNRVLLPMQITDPAGVAAVPLGNGFRTVTAITHAEDDRLFIAEQTGRVKILHPDGRITTFLDITNKVLSNKGEYGFYDVAFHPGYRDPGSPGFGLFYVTYTTGYDIDFDNREVFLNLSRFRVSADPDVADPATETILMHEKQSFDVHKGGDMDFDKRDNMLYVGIGEDRLLLIAQSDRSPKGKIVRLPVDSVPPDVTGDAIIAEEIWAFGLRNPWRIDVDEPGNNIYVGDVGDAIWEEVNLVPMLVKGFNYGWPCMEGPDRIPEANDIPECKSNFQQAISLYMHRDGSGRCAVIGGKVYRPDSNPNDNRYIFGDMCTSEIFALTFANGAWERSLLARVSDLGLLGTFGEDRFGNIYFGTLSLEAPIYRLYIP